MLRILSGLRKFRAASITHEGIVISCGLYERTELLSITQFTC